MGLEDSAHPTQAFGPGFEDIRCRIPDLSRLRGTINFVQRYSMEDILREVIEAGRGRRKS